MDELSKLQNDAFKAFKDHRFDESERLYKEVLKIDPANTVAGHTLGVIAEMTGRNLDAIKRMHETVKYMPNDPSFFYNFGLMLQKQSRYNEAVKNYKEAVRLKPDYINALNNIGAILLITGKLSEAEEYLFKAIEVDKNYYMSYNNLGSVYKDQGRYEEAIENYRKALSIKPDDASSASNLLLTLCYVSEGNRDEVFHEHKQFEKRFTSISRIDVGDRKTKAADEPLSVGYLSPDFRTHSVSYFIEPILRHHDRSRFNIFCYADNGVSDNITKRLNGLCKNWRRIFGKKDDVVAEMIVNDGIDILVDLAGHSGYNRLPLFMRKPAPVQITYLGYPNTTGLSSMDYRISDEMTDPMGDEKYYTEKLIRLSKGFLCYNPPQDAPAVSEPPSIKNGYITFGSFNNLPKITPGVIETWVNILKKVPESRLLIKTKSFNDETVQRLYGGHFQRRGISPERLIFTGHAASLKEHLELYNRLDIALDTFPYNGTTTTLESLWMGVPVVVLAGAHHAGRVGVSILSRLGLNHMIAESPKQYIAICAFLANDLDRLSKFRKALRRAVKESSLCDGKSFTAELERAYLEMWQNYLKNTVNI